MKQLPAATIFLLLLLAASARAEEAAPARTVKLHTIDVKTPRGMVDLFKPGAERFPLISAHRGGSGKGWPENCIETFQHTLEHTFAIMEVDPRYTKDGHIVLHHDATLERTTSGKGKVADHTLAELKQLRLKDAAGTLTDYTIPTLDEALAWAKGKTILVLDQKDVPARDRLKKVMELKAEAHAMLIIYSFADAKACYETSKDIMMEVMIPSRAKGEEFEKTGVPWANVIAFVGHTPPRETELGPWLHGKGASCMTGTSRNLDKQLMKAEGDARSAIRKEYEALLKSGVDLFEADAAREVGRLLYSETSVPTEKAKYFRVD
ncbi:MAG: glycerophosphodiester phosphodiesterase family protein [Phycisphaeraceae bacterium]